MWYFLYTNVRHNLFIIWFTADANILWDTKHPEGMKKIQALEGRKPAPREEAEKVKKAKNRTDVCVKDICFSLILYFFID